MANNYNGACRYLQKKLVDFSHPNRMIQFTLSPPSFVCVYHEVFTK
jgi:hypothetical protein